MLPVILSIAALVGNEVVGHAKQIGAAVGDRPGRLRRGLDPQFLQQVFGFPGVAAACPKEAQKVGPVLFDETDESGVAGRQGSAWFHASSRF